MNLITINNIRGYINDEATAMLSIEDVSIGLGFTQKKGEISYVRWETVSRYLNEFGFSHLVGKDDYIPENIFYLLAMKANNETAIKFQKKVANEILPSIRKHGAYMTPGTIEKTLTNPDFIIQLATQLKTEQQARITAEAKIEADKPLVHFAESLQISKDSILIGELAKLLRQNGIMFGARRLFEQLRTDGYLIKSGSEYNNPTQRSMELGIMEIRVGTRNSSDGTPKVTHTTKITGKGQIYFINKYKPFNQAM